MSYTVTIKNDAKFSNGDGIVHTWLELNATGEETIYFGFSPKKGQGYFNVEGVLDDDDYLKKRIFSEAITLEVSEKQYNAMADKIQYIKENMPLYNLIPGDNNDYYYNCTKMNRYVLESGDIYFLSGAQTPFGVAGRINGIAADIVGIAGIVDMSDLTEIAKIAGITGVSGIVGITTSIAAISTAITASGSIKINEKTYDIGLIENALDAKDLIDTMHDDAYNTISNYASTVQTVASTAVDNILDAISEALNASKAIINDAMGVIGNATIQNGLIYREAASYYQQGLQNLADSIVHLLNGGALPVEYLDQCILPLDMMIPDMTFPGLIPEGACGPDLNKAENTTSPIILDLDGDGIETRGLEESIFFDHDGNQFAENSGWVAADDGLLVMDRNGDGVIDSGSELFGNNTLLDDGTLAKNGYQALQALDANQDGVLNAEDAVWQQLNVWQDRNGNAQVDAGELLSLEEAGVAAIGTGYRNSTFVDAQGNAHKQTGTITMQDGTTHNSADVWFTANTGYTRYTGDADIARDIRELPYIRGFGNMTDLHIAIPSGVVA